MQVVRNGSGNGGIITGIDFTNLASISFDYQNNASGQYVGYLQVYIDDTLYVQYSTAAGVRNVGTFGVSQVKGVHNLKFLIYSANTTSYIYNITTTPMPKFADNEVIKNGFLNPKYTISGGSFAPDNLYVPYGGVNSGGALLNEIDLTDYTGFNIEYANSHATYRLMIGRDDSTNIWTSAQTTSRASNDSGNILGSLTGKHSLRFYAYGDNSQYARIYNLTLY